ncbi:MAG: bifunctional acetate--CoA ligase family protein/GNAT family N-acetyltransferase [Chromatiales bacterium]|jgi:acetyltransferase
MSIRNLELMFKPKSVALFGASDRPDSLGARLLQNLTSSGFAGDILPVNPKYQRLNELSCYADVNSLPQTPDLAIIATPPTSVPGLVDQLGARGCKAAVIITAGFSGSEAAAELQQSLQQAASAYGMRIIGPNCLGILAPSIGLNASFAHITPKAGKLAFIAQSGAIITSVMDWAQARHIGFSHLVSLGDMQDVDFGDMLDYLANDWQTRAILLYIETVTNARKFMSAARAAARMKPVIVVKAGRHAEGARAVASHTGSLAGEDGVYNAVFQRAGMLRVYTLEELFDAVETLALTHAPKGNRLAILSNGGGIGVLATDALIDRGGQLAQLSEQSIQRLNQVLPPTWSHANPVDIIGDAPGSRYADALDILCQDQGVDGILVLNCPTAIASGEEAARAVIDAVAERHSLTLLTSWVGADSTALARKLFIDRQIPTFDTPEQAVRAFMYLHEYRRSQEMLMETPASVPEDFTPDSERARQLISQALAEQRDWLSEPEAKQVLAAYGIPVMAARIAKTPEQAAAIAAELGGSIALKILSADITHKSDVGGVALDLAGPAAVKQAADHMLERVAKVHPQARIDGFSVQAMAYRPGAYELIVGMIEDVQFGPVMLVGQGGIAVEVVNDKALGLPPLNMRLAREMLSRTRIYQLLKGYRNLPAANLDAIALTMIRLAQLVIDVPEVVELDINPLLADEYGVVALDARIKVRASDAPGAVRLAIRPYPKELEQSIPIGDGRSLLLRPILPEDEPSLQAAFAKLTPEEVRLRFFVPMSTLSHVTAARFTQIDYDREMALILAEPGIPGKMDIFGVVRIIADPDNERAEYAIIVRHDMTGLGLGVLLMQRIIEYARQRGIREVFGDVLRENKTMRKLCEVLGFTEAVIPDEPAIVRVTLKLAAKS